MRTKRFEMHSPKDDFAVTGLIIIAILLAYFACTGCITMRSGPEPKWVPNVFRFVIEGTDGAFYNAEAEAIKTSDPRIHDFILIPYLDFQKGVEKYDQCRAWR